MMNRIQVDSGANLKSWDEEVIDKRSKYIAKSFAGLIPTTLLS
jgi:hypothetical protein